jgi:hypothetical protein
MFHHFYDEQHPRGQGAISSEDLVALIRHVGRDRILLAQEWLSRADARTLGDTDVCLTFDDALLSQYEVAIPVLEDMGLTAFWFVYSSVFQGKLEPLEIYRKFRTTSFETVDDFYEEFFKIANTVYPDECRCKLGDFRPDQYLAEFPFYTRNDRIFRFLRDDVLKPERYHRVMDGMIVIAHAPFEGVKTVRFRGPRFFVAARPGI